MENTQKLVIGLGFMLIIVVVLVIIVPTHPLPTTPTPTPIIQTFSGNFGANPGDGMSPATITIYGTTTTNHDNIFNSQSNGTIVSVSPDHPTNEEEFNQMLAGDN